MAFWAMKSPMAPRKAASKSSVAKRAPGPSARKPRKKARPETSEGVALPRTPSQAQDTGDLVELALSETPVSNDASQGLAVGEDGTLVPNLKATALSHRKASPARRDALSTYFSEIKRHPLLSREEEASYARRFRESGDLRAAYRLVAANLRLVVKLAHEYHRNPIALLDLIQEGNVGLMHAVKKFDPDRGAKLSTYAAWWIRAYILRYIMDNWKMVKIGTTEAQRKLFFKLRQEQERLSAQGYEVTPKLLADRLSVTEAEVEEMDRRLGRDELSLDTPMNPNEEGSDTRGDRLPDKEADAEHLLGDEQLRQVFRDRLESFAATLNEKDRYLFDVRLMADAPRTLQEIGAEWGVSRERVRQIEAALIERIRGSMKEHIPDFDLVTVTEPET